MAKPSILISRILPESVMDRARAEFDVTARDSEEPMGCSEAAAALGSHDGILLTLADRFSAEAFASAGEIRCRILANFGVGYDHIDVAAAAAHGIAVTNTPGAVTDATADIAVSLMLMTARRTAEGDRLVRSGHWGGWHPTQLLGRQVTGRTVGIIGMGRIGQAIAKRCHFGFGMPIVFANRSRISDPGVPASQLSGIDEVFRAADYAVVSVSGGQGNHHFIGSSELRHLRPHAILVNISRGDVIDEVSLIAHLKSGGLAGVGLDVYEFEPRVPKELAAMENVVLLPHLGTAVLEVRESMGQMAIANLSAFYSGRPLPNPAL